MEEIHEIELKEYGNWILGMREKEDRRRTQESILGSLKKGDDV